MRTKDADGLLRGRPVLAAVVLSMALPLAAGPSRAEPSALVPLEQARTPGGLPLVAVAAPESPWAVVQLHVRALGTGLTPEEADGIGAFARALAEGQIKGGRAPSARAQVAAAGGVTRMWRAADSIVISDAVPASSLDVALSAMNARLAGRRRLDSAPTFPPSLDDDRRVPRAARQLLAPGHPYALALDGAATVDDKLRAQIADRLLKRDGVVVVVLGALDSRKLRAAVGRRLNASLPPGALPLDDVAHPQGVRLVEGAPAFALKGPGGTPPTALWFPASAPLRLDKRPDAGPDVEARERIRDQAALRVVARLLDLDLERRAGVTWLRAAVSTGGEQAERQRLQEIAAVAEHPLDPVALARVRQLERSDVARRTADPELLCFDLGRAALVFGDARMVEWELAELEAVTPERLGETAMALFRGPRVVVRSAGATSGGGQ